MDVAWPLAALVVLAGYLFGSIPFGLLLTRAAGLGDVRSIGSGNIGATNVLRTGRKDLAAGTLLLDALKGAAAVLLGSWAGGPLLAALGAVAAFAGHLFPVWLGFKGGKGVATYIGCLFALSWPAGLSFAGIWIAVAILSRTSSLAALTAALATPPVLWARGEDLFALVFVLLTALIFWKHSANIARLRAGTESRIGGTKP